MQQKNAILGAVEGYDYAVLRPFISSLRATRYAGDIVLFHNRVDDRTLRRLRKHGVVLVPFSETFPYMEPALAAHNRWSEKQQSQRLEVTSFRHIIAYCYLMAYPGRYQYVMLTDTRDVIFQKNPFDFSIDGKLCYFTEREGISIGQKVETRWIRHAFGPATAYRLSEKPIVSAGITIGPMESIIAHLEQMIEAIFECPAPEFGTDQAVLNVIAHERPLPGTVLFENNNGPIMHLNLEDSVRKNPAGLVINARGDVPNVVHQHDRHWRSFLRHQSIRLLWRRARLSWKHWRHVPRRKIKSMVRKMFGLFLPRLR